MIDLDSLNPYEVLDVDPRSTIAEIKRAFQIALKTYGPGHMATCGLFTEEQREEILNKVQEAYNILMDPERRRQWDDILRQKGLYPQQDETKPSLKMGPAEILPRGVTSMRTIPKPPKEEDLSRKEEIESMVKEILQQAMERREWTGAIFRKIREIRGLSLEDVAQKTKIGRGHIRSIEEDAYTFLPPDVYVKGFLTQIAKVLKVDPELVVPPLMERIRRTRGPR